MLWHFILSAVNKIFEKHIATCLKMKTQCSSTVYDPVYQTTGCHISDGSILNIEVHPQELPKM